MSVSDKLKVSMSLFHKAWQLKHAAIRQFYPELSEAEVRQKVKEAFLYARS
jgi:hypothetical protein